MLYSSPLLETLLRELVRLSASHRVSEASRKNCEYEIWGFCQVTNHLFVYLFLNPLQVLSIAFAEVGQSRAESAGTRFLSALQLYRAVPFIAWRSVTFTLATASHGDLLRDRRRTLFTGHRKRGWKAPLVRPHWLKQGSLRQVVRGHVPGFGYTHGQTLHSFSRQPVAVINSCPIKKKGVSHVQMKFPILILSSFR